MGSKKALAKDSTSVDLPVPDYRAGLEKGVKGIKIGVPKEYRADGMDGGIKNPIGARALYLWQGKKDTLFRLELRHQAGTISEQEYLEQRARAEKTIRDLVKG